MQQLLFSSLPRFLQALLMGLAFTPCEAFQGNLFQKISNQAYIPNNNAAKYILQIKFTE